MSTLALDREPASLPRPVAPLWHTLLLILLFLAMAVGGASVQQRAASHSRSLPRPGAVAPLYVSMLLMEWGLVLYVAKGGLRRAGVSIRELVGGRWSRPRDVALDVLLALGAWGIWTAFDFAWARWMVPDHAAGVGALLPRSPLEIALWVALSLTAGFVEELIFRGYFQAQFHALTRRSGAALILQAALFGISHGYQGAQACLKIALYGLLMGALARGRGSLRPGMMAHAWTDIASGLFRI
jgi:membrane protease YdiL (CAAX protease family)